MSREKKVLNQISLQQKMVSKAGVNLVNCGRCGSVMLHEINQDKIQCPFCSFKSDPCDFPDYFYEGLELSGEFKERLTMWEIIDKNGVVHSGSEDEMDLAFDVMVNPNDYEKAIVDTWAYPWEGDLKLVEVHIIKYRS